MKVYEFGKEHTKSFVMFQCAAEPWWAFKASAEEMAKNYHVYLFIADGHDALGTEFVSLEKYAKDAAEYLRKQSVNRVDGMYGVSLSQTDLQADLCEGLDHGHAGHQVTAAPET